MNYHRLILGPLATNCYILWNAQNNAVVIDPGAEGETIQALISEEKLSPAAVILTHGHYDHISATRFIVQRYEIPVLAHPEELDIIQNPSKNYSAFTDDPISIEAEPLTAAFLESIELPFQIIHLPGHTPGGIGLVGEEFFVSGDTVFAGGGFGRTDLPGGDTDALVQSVEKILELPDELFLLPGHGGRSIVGREKPLWRQAIQMLKDGVI